MDEQKRRYTFGNDEFSLEAAYHDCKLVFDGITDDDSFKEADTGLILYYANEIIYALHEALDKDTNVLSNDCISRQAAIDVLTALEEPAPTAQHLSAIYDCEDAIKALPSEQPEPLSDAYMNAVWTWLLDYQIKAAKLKGRYTPYEVLSWVANDWRKEHERSDKQTGGSIRHLRPANA